jgi:xanthosine utilization system XapX-like protein
MRNIQDTIIQKIKDGEVSMKPRWHFLLESFLWIVGGVMVFLIAIYLLSFVMFILRVSGVGLVPLYGMRGIIFLIATSPWVLIITTGLFIGILYVLVRRYSFSYRTPVIYTLLGTVIGVLVLSSIIHMLAMHAQLRSLSERHAIPGFSQLYKRMPERPEGIYFGKIITIDNESFTLQKENDVLVTVTLHNWTRLPSDPLSEGTVVIIFGESVSSSSIQAFGVRPVLRSDWRHLPPRLRDRFAEGTTTMPELIRP